MESSLSSLVEGLANWGWSPGAPSEHERVGPSLLRIAPADPREYVEQMVGSLMAGESVVLRPQGLEIEEDPAVPILRGFEPRADLGPCILIATGGTTGGIRFAIHTPSTLWTAAQGFAQQFRQWPRRHVSPLPLEHVGGIMPVFRAIAAGGRAVFADYKDWMEKAPSENELPSIVSLVPTQLRRLMNSETGLAWLHTFRCILMGGAPLEETDRNRARELGLRVSPCYGMTETSAMITVNPPEAFLAGDDTVGLPLPHARITLLPPEQRIIVMGDMLCHGYWPVRPDFSRDPLFTGDRGAWEPAGHLRVLGRLDRMINTGGEKVDPSVVEERVMTLPGVTEALAFGLDDSDWGQRLVVAVAGELEVTEDAVWSALRETRRPCEVPKTLRLWPWRLPRTGTGKPNWRRLRSAFETDAPPAAE